MSPREEMIKNAYSCYNARDIDSLLSMMHPNVRWPNGWEGGYLYGHTAVRDYWTRQWKELDPNVQPIGCTEREDGTLEVAVSQVIRDRNGNLVSKSTVRHIYAFEDELIKNMEIAIVQ